MTLLGIKLLIKTNNLSKNALQTNSINRLTTNPQTEDVMPKERYISPKKDIKLLMSLG